MFSLTPFFVTLIDDPLSWILIEQKHILADVIISFKYLKYLY